MKYCADTLPVAGLNQGLPTFKCVISNVKAKILVALGACLLVMNANAAVNITIQPSASGTDVVATASGSHKVVQAIPFGDIFPNTASIMPLAMIKFSPTINPASTDLRRLIVENPTCSSNRIGSGSNFVYATSTSVTGDPFSYYFGSNFISVPTSSARNDVINVAASMTFAGQTLTSMGLAVGTVTCSWGPALDRQSMTISVLSAPAPAVTSISQNSGTTAGGTAVTITGTNLTGATGVTIGGVAATSVTVVNATSITAITPAHAAGTASVLVTTPGGTNAANTLYTYVTPIPTLTSLTPNSGSVAGGAVVTITGTNFTGTTGVTIGGVAATSFSIVSATSITATTPAHAAGTASVVVTTPAGSNSTNTLYSYTPLQDQSSLTVSASPSALNATITTSTLSTSGGSGTGAVSFAMTAGTCTLSGTTVTAGSATETCTVTATKAADSTYLAATATVNITVSHRATLAAAANDASVAKTQGSQLMQSQKFVQTQVQNITSHLDSFRHSFNLMPSNMGISINTPSLGQMAPVFYKVKDVWSGNSGESTASSLRKVGMKDAAQPSTDNKLYNDYNNPDEIDEQAAIEQRIYAYERKQETYSFWSAGTIDTGLFKTGDNKDVTNKFRVNGLTFGLDYKAGPRAILGAAFGVGQGTNNTQELQSTVKSTQQSFTGYGMLGFGDNWVVDGLLGYSSLSFTGNRTTSDSLATLGMNRTGDSTFASTSLSKIFTFGAFRVAPFVREDVTHIRLGQYNETGAADYALGYDTARYTATATSAGLHFANDIYLDRGKLTTTAKISANRMSTGSMSQDVYYADTGMAGGIYTLQQSSSYQNSRALSLGIMYSNKAGDGIDIGWMGAMGANQYKLNGLRFGARFAM